MRASKGAARTQAKKRLFKRAKGFVGGRRKLFRTVKETLLRAGKFAYRDRRVKKRDFRRLWITRLSAACRERDIRYSQFIAGLAKANIQLDRKSLSEIAIADPPAFDAVVVLVKKALGIQAGRALHLQLEAGSGPLPAVPAFPIALMALPQFLADLDALLAEANAAFVAAADGEALEAARIEFLGAAKGRLKAVQKGLGTVAKEDKPAAGKRLNEVKEAIESAFTSAKDRLESAGPAAAGGASFDPTLPGKPLRVGRLHPISQTIDELKDIMGRLGFTPAEGPEIEDERHNFEALNIPLEHPARDPLDNFYLAVAAAGAGEATAPPHQEHATPLLLRSQTSTVQIRVMERQPPPIRIISLGRVYRPDAADATHYPMFHQMEGLLIDRHATLADLKSVLRMFATGYLGSDVHVRFRPSFFPFTEPSVECDYYWNDRWIEFGGAGMVDPNVLQAVGYDPEEVSGFAFGLGVERLCMRRHGITDIREFYKNDVRFLQQF